ncbi:nicotinate-nicotinamide nucleotide adenylyltransferase [Clostridia bacterium]|nr:nicotinate-nicotinamide nucleotide adenylyltransferase [Clostridia bacterium]
MSNPKIGILGGTFDPIHYGHLLLAECAAEQFSLEQVLFLPAGTPPHKIEKPITDAKWRSEMIELAIADNSRFSISTLETRSAEISYTYKTLENLKEQSPDTQFFFILGGDSLFEFETWYLPERILAAATILAAVREDLDGERFDRQIALLKERFEGAFIERLNTPNVGISSRKIRTLISEGKSVRYMLPEVVIDYIREKGLYSTESN